MVHFDGQLGSFLLRWQNALEKQAKQAATRPSNAWRDSAYALPLQLRYLPGSLQPLAIGVGRMPTGNGEAFLHEIRTETDGGWMCSHL